MFAETVNALANPLSQLMNLVPAPGKLTIIPVSSYAPDLKPAGLAPYVAMFNPENLQLRQNIRYERQQPNGANGAQQNFASAEPRTLTFDLLIDGTGASGELREVGADVTLLDQVLGFNGKDHQPHKLYIIWGTQLFQGVCTSFSVRYTLFRANGTPLRATVSLSFDGDLPLLKLFLEMNLQSADLTHRRRIRTHDRLDLLCHKIYDDSRHYLGVALANGLTTVRKLPEGAELVFPPIEK